MNYLTAIFSFIILVLPSAKAQKNLVALKAKLLSADSVLIISHENTAQFYIEDSTVVKHLYNSSLLENGKINEKIIREKKILSKTAVQRLSKILTRIPKVHGVDMANAAERYHAVLIYKDGQVSYADIFLVGRTIRTSKDIHLSEDDFDNRKWEELWSFFLQNHINYELVFDKAIKQN